MYMLHLLHLIDITSANVSMFFLEQCRLLSQLQSKDRQLFYMAFLFLRNQSIKFLSIKNLHRLNKFRLESHQPSNSGGVSSIVVLMAAIICFTDLSNARCTSSLKITTSSGSPVTKFLPRIAIPFFLSRHGRADILF